MANPKLQPITDHAGRVAFVKQLDLGEPRYSLPMNFQIRDKLPPDYKKEGYIVSGALTAFTENVSGQAKQDILDATLLAQLGCDKKYDRERDTVNWYTYYNHILGNLGFVIQNFEFEEYNATGSSIKMDEVVLEIVGAIATENEKAVIAATLDALKKMSKDDKRIVLFDKHGSHSTLGNFQVYPCKQAPDGEVSLSLGVFHFKASDKDSNFLFFSWSSSSTSVYKGAQKTVFNSEVYARVRSTVSAKLGDNAINLVASIDI